MDPEGTLKSGVPLCPPAGDAGTGMVATNSVRPRTGNVSAGTSVFSMLVLEKALDKVYPEIDLVATPEGNSVAMVHANNCTGDLDAWISLFGEFGQLFHMEISREELYAGLYCRALEGDADCGGLLAYNYLSGEHITCMEEGRPLFIRGKNSRFTLANFMRTHLCTALGAIKQGNDLLLKEEGVKAEMIRAQGGFFKTGGVGQKILATALNTTVSVLETVGEGGAWGIAVLAAYMLWCRKQETLSDFLDHQVFAQVQSICVEPDPAEVEGFDIFMKRYRAGLGIERAAVEALE